MKKLTFMALAAIAIVAASCNRIPKADVKSDVDTLAYAFGLSQAEGLSQAVAQNGVDSTYMDEFFKGLMEGANQDPNDKKALAHSIGVQFGQIISQRMVPGVNNEIFGNDSTKTISLKNFMAGLICGVKGEQTLMTPEEARATVDRLMTTLKAKQFEEKKQEGADYLAKFVKEGAAKLPCGVAYKILKEGKGECPTDSSTVKVHYEGKTIDGKVFDSSYNRGEPAEMRADQVIKGWTEVLKVMPVGSKWEVVIPADLAYGERGAGQDIPPYSTLIFTIELVSIKK